jgi:hypothetical protein
LEEGDAFLRSPRTEEPTMTNERKVIRAKVGLLELARQLGNVSQACKIMHQSCATRPGRHP